MPSWRTRLSGKFWSMHSSNARPRRIRIIGICEEDEPFGRPKEDKDKKRERERERRACSLFVFSIRRREILSEKGVRLLCRILRYIAIRATAKLGARDNLHCSTRFVGNFVRACKGAWARTALRLRLALNARKNERRTWCSLYYVEPFTMISLFAKDKGWCDFCDIL